MSRLSYAPRSAERAIAVREASTLLADSVAERRFTMVLLISFAGLGLVLAVVGVYGTLSYSVSRRRREIGVRMAIGAGRPAVQRLVVLEGLRLVASGVVLGLVGTALATGALRSLLFGVGPGDPPTLAAVIGLVAAVALVACWLPAARASRVEPTQALREG